ncbi:MAG: hypothetical protein J0H49_24775 [Acidobacteria bacterium]|nr:hypothetical protein [Acidobacteriota bacterium]
MRRILQVVAVYITGCLCAAAAAITLTDGLAPGIPNHGIPTKMTVTAPDSLSVESWGTTKPETQMEAVCPAAGSGSCADPADELEEHEVEWSGIEPAMPILGPGVYFSLQVTGSQAGASLGNGLRELGRKPDRADGAEAEGSLGIGVSNGALPVPEPSTRTSLILVATVALIWLWRHVSPTR